MTSLVTVVGIGKGTWAEVIRLINAQQWDSIFLITNEFGKEKFQSPKGAELILIDPSQAIEEMIEKIRTAMDGKINDTDVALNISSGSGKEHMAVIASILKLGLGIRLVSLDSSGSLKEI